MPIGLDRADGHHETANHDPNHDEQPARTVSIEHPPDQKTRDPEAEHACRLGPAEERFADVEVFLHGPDEESEIDPGHADRHQAHQRQPGDHVPAVENARPGRPDRRGFRHIGHSISEEVIYRFGVKRGAKAIVRQERMRISAAVRASDGDDHFSASVTLSDITDSLGCLAKRVPPVDHGCDLAGFNELLQNDQVIFLRQRKKRARYLANEH